MTTVTKKLPRQWVGLALASSLFLLALLLPLPLTAPQRRLIAVLVLTFTLWVTEALPLPVTALLGVTLCVLLGIVPAEQAFASFGNPILFLFLGAFMLAEAIRVHGLDRRWAEWLLARPTFSRSPFRLLTGFGVATWAMSAWMSNTATTATIYPLAWQAFQELRPRLSNASAFGTALMLTCAYASSIGGILTPVGTPPNLIGLGFLQKLAGISIGFVQWMLIAIPIGLAMLVAHLLWARWLFGVKGGQLLTMATERLKTPMTAGERNTAFAFGLTVALWMLTGLLALLLGADAPFVKAWERHCPEAIPAMLGAMLLFLLPDHRQERQTLTWQEAVRIDWGILLLFGGGMALGDAMFRTGLAERIGAAIHQLPFADSLWGLTAWSVAIAVLLTELVSNVAATNMLVPMVIAAAKEANLSPVAPVLGATLGCTLAFALPIGTGPNAIVYASGLVPFRQMLRMGVLLDITSIVVIWLLLRLLCPLLGLA
jgi:sodium-dependent dicarboxylate transporter 2/3/5